MSTSDPPWITPLVKYLLRKKKRAADKDHVHKAEDLSSKFYKLIGENRKNCGKNGAQGSLHWWRKKITLRKQKPRAILEMNFLLVLHCNDYFGDLCNDENYVKPVPLEVIVETHPPPELQEFDVIIALSKIKKTATGPYGLPSWVWRDNCTTLAPVVTALWNKSVFSYTWSTAWKEANINPLLKVDTPVQHSDFQAN